MRYYDLFAAVCNRHQNNIAINNIRYSELYDIIESKEYVEISVYHDYRVILDILTAAKHNKPIIIPPKDNRDYSIPASLPKEFCIIMFSSGSTGTRKPIIYSEKMLLSNCEIAIACQNITSNDIVFNVCSMNHSGGLNVQVLPGLLVGANIIVEEWDSFKFFRRLIETQATLTHLVPRLMNVIRKVKSTNLRFIAAGSDCIKREHVEPWLKHGIPFMINYGQTESGPIVINHTFTSLKELEIFNHGIPLGDKVWCEYKIKDNELFLKGNNIITANAWHATGDCVFEHNGWIMYNGRKSAGCKLVSKRY